MCVAASTPSTRSLSALPTSWANSAPADGGVDRHGAGCLIGGVGAIAVAGLWMVLFPQLRKVRHLDGRN